MAESTPQPQQQAAESDEIELGQLLDILLSGKWWIVASTAAAGALGFGYATLSTEIYAGDTLVQIETGEQSMVPGLFGDQGGGSGGGFLQQGPTVSTQIQILKSRSMLGKVVDELNLTIQERPRYFPLVGEYMATHYGGEQPLAASWLGLERYAWGGERIEVSRLELGPAYDPAEDGPLVITAEDGQAYTLHTAEGERLTAGTVGEPLTLREGEALRVGLFVAELRARPGTQFLAEHRPRQAAIEELRSRLSISERGEGSGILEIRMEHPDPQHIETVLDTLTQHYVRQHVQQKSEEAAKQLEFLQKQLPNIRQDLRAAEERLSDFRQQQHAVDLSKNASSLLEQIVKVEQELANLQVKEEELRLNYGEKHPRFEALRARQSALQSRKEELEEQIGTLPEKQQQALRLEREVEVSTSLYTNLLNTAQELRVVRAGTVGNVRILDQAQAGNAPVRPRRTLTTALGAVLGGMLGVFGLFGREFLRRSINEPDSMERVFGLPVFATVPHVPEQPRAERRARAKREPVPVLTRERPLAPVAESLRSLRTSLTFALMRQTRNVLMLSSPHPDSGKTFLSVNLASLIAEGGQRVLLIDGDMRRGRIHEYLPQRQRTPGLSDILAGQSSLEEAAVRLDGRDMDILATGTIPPNPSELLMQERFQELLAEAEQRYDVVLIDTSPVLAVADAAIIGTSAGATMLIARAGYTGEREMHAAIQRLEQATVKVAGLILNDFQSKKAAGGRYQYYYYDYKYTQKRKA